MRGFTPLHCAAESGKKEMVALLLDKGADINARNDIQNTPLHEAAWHGHLETVKFLLEKGANPNLTAVDGKTPLALAKKAYRTEICDFLSKLSKDEEMNATASAPVEIK